MLTTATVPVAPVPPGGSGHRWDDSASAETIEKSAGVRNPALFVGQDHATSALYDDDPVKRLAAQDKIQKMDAGSGPGLHAEEIFESYLSSPDPELRSYAQDQMAAMGISLARAL